MENTVGKEASDDIGEIVGHQEDSPTGGQLSLCVEV